MTDADEVLLDELRTAVAATAAPPPPHVVAAAHSAYTWRTIDAELALLAYDSADDVELAGVRGDGPRLLSFAAEGLGIDVEVAHDPHHRSLTGEAVPAPERFELQRSGGDAIAIECDPAGRFRMDGVAPGPARFRVVIGRRIVTTGWVAI